MISMRKESSSLIATDKTHRTRYLKSVKPPDTNMLKSASYNKKLGKTVSIKKWKDMPMFALTLEERNTCTTACNQYKICYGNNMPFAKRHDHTDPDFLDNLDASINNVPNQRGSKDGFVVRLHVLGDFYSKAYVNAWQSALNKYPGLHAFGYTHHRHDSPIGKQLKRMNEVAPDRWQIRFSDDMDDQFRARVISGTYDKSLKHFTDYDHTEVLPNEIVCPEQLGKTMGCTSCGYCWSSQNPVVFLAH